MLLFHAPLILTHFWPASTLLRGHLALATLSPPETDLKFWSVGATLMRFTWANISERRILVLNFGLTCNSLSELHTLDWLRHVSALPEKTSAASCLEIRNPIAVHQMIDVEMIFVPTSYHASYQVSPIDRKNKFSFFFGKYITSFALSLFE